MLPAVLRHEPRYRLLFAGQALSVLGDRITYVALAFAVLAIGDVSDLGWVTAAAALPFLIVALPGGAVSDRLGRRRVMIVADLVRATTQATIAVLLLTGRAEIWMLAALMAGFGTADAFFGPALQGLIPQTVAATRVQDANALIGLASHAGAIIGPGDRRRADRDLRARRGDRDRLRDLPRQCVLPLAPASRGRSPGVGDGDEPHDLMRSLREGWEIVRGDRLDVARPGCARRVPDHGVAVGVRPRPGDRREPARRCVELGADHRRVRSRRGDRQHARPAPQAGAHAARVLRRDDRGLAAGRLRGERAQHDRHRRLEVVGGIGVSLFFTLWETTIQQQIPPEATARVSAYDWAISVGLMPVGLALAGPLAAAIGIETAMRLGSAIAMVAAIGCLCVPVVWGLRRPPPSRSPDRSRTPRSGSPEPTGPETLSPRNGTLSPQEAPAIHWVPLAGIAMTLMAPVTAPARTRRREAPS